MIKLEDCKDGFLYFIEARNATIGIYDKKELGFIISRHKFKSNFLFIEYHWDIGKIKPDMEYFGTVKPLKELCPTNISFLSEDEKLKFLNEMEISKKDEIDIYKCDNPETEIY
jgi:hypothetical protein